MPPIEPRPEPWPFWGPLAIILTLPPAFIVLVELLR